MEHRIGDCDRLGDQDLLLLLDLLGEFKRNLQNLGNNLGRRERKPLRQRDVGDAVRFVDFNPDEVFGLGSVLDVVAVGGDPLAGRPQGTWTG